jgi:hypothetical protein
MLFDDDFHGDGAAFMATGAPADLHGTDVGHGAASAIATTAANDDWLLGTGLHPLDASLSPPGGDAGGGIGGITGGATAADHDKMLVINPIATDPNYYAPPPPKPIYKKVSTMSWYQYDPDVPLATPARPT